MDIRYLTNELSPSAVPAMVESLPSIPEPTRSELADSLRQRYVDHPRLLEQRWYEWNLGRARARDALDEMTL
jgi:hypothetical protein